MNARDIKRFNEILQRKRQEVVRGLHNLEQQYNGSNRDASGYGIHIAEMGSEEEELEKSLTLLGEEEDLLAQIDSALDRIERRVYGVCDACSGRIGKARLLAKPFAQLCIDCRRKTEGERYR